MGGFWEALGQSQKKVSVEGRRWHYVPYDQLTDCIGPLATEPPDTLGIVLIESSAKAARRPYHKQKLLWVLASMRHFALEQAARGVAVDYRCGSQSYAPVLREVAAKRGPLRMMRAAERELREELAPLVVEGLLEVEPHPGWLTSAEDFDALGGAPWRMDAFYRRVRRRTGVLMDAAGKPVGGRYSFDGENRLPWPGTPVAPSPPSFSVDPIVQEVVALIEREFADHPGTLHPERVAARQSDADAAWDWALTKAMPHFGPYEDAMSEQSTTLFHTLISPLLHNHRLLPANVVRDVEAREELTLASREGFIRQVLGWREFMRHVHERTDGLRTLPEGYVAETLGAGHPLPAAFWSGGPPSGLRCLDQVVKTVWDEGYSHHITRLMVLSNLATLLDLSPRELTDWFWVAYVDAYDWVVEPNVLGMGTFSVGPLYTTKPYVSGSAYINKMGDFCGSCAFHPKKSCPITRLYWAFLARHEPTLRNVERCKLQLASLRRRNADAQARDADTFEAVRRALSNGETLGPSDLP